MKYRTGKLIYNTTVVVLIICGIIWVSSRFVHLGRVEYTDNAQVKQLIVPVNSRVQGSYSAYASTNTRPCIRAIRLP